MAALRERFAAGLAQRAAEIAGAPDAGTLLAALHRLAGAAGSFGFEELGRAARAAERVVRDTGSTDGPAVAEVLALLAGLAASDTNR